MKGMDVLLVSDGCEIPSYSLVVLDGESWGVIKDIAVDSVFLIGLNECFWIEQRDR